MTRAMTAGVILAGCWAVNVCLAHPAADSIAGAPGPGHAGAFSAAGVPTVAGRTSEWNPVAELLSPYRVHPSVLDADWLSDRFLRDPSNTSGAGLGVGYAWRNMRLEGALIHMREGRNLPIGAGAPKLFTAATSRLSYQPSSNLTFQLVRGHLSRQNVTDSDEDVHRTSVAASYSRPLHSSNWQTILAVGRSTGRADGSSNNKVYLLESSLRLAKMHTIFARMERASAAELFTERDALFGQNFNANRLTLGYVYAIPLSARSQMTLGSVVAKRTMPEEAIAVLGANPPSYKVFMRMLLQMP